MHTSIATCTVAVNLPADLPAAETDSEPTAVPAASGISANLPNDNDPRPDHVRHLVFGTPPTVQATIRLLHHLGYAEPNDWSRPMSTGRANEVMVILTKRVCLG